MHFRVNKYINVMEKIYLQKNIKILKEKAGKKLEEGIAT